MAVGGFAAIPISRPSPIPNPGPSFQDTFTRVLSSRYYSPGRSRPFLFGSLPATNCRALYYWRWAHAVFSAPRASALRWIYSPEYHHPDDAPTGPGIQPAPVYLPYRSSHLRGLRAASDAMTHFSFILLDLRRYVYTLLIRNPNDRRMKRNQTDPPSEHLCINSRFLVVVSRSPSAHPIPLSPRALPPRPHFLSVSGIFPRYICRALCVGFPPFRLVFRWGRPCRLNMYTLVGRIARLSAPLLYAYKSAYDNHCSTAWPQRVGEYTDFV